MSYCSSSTGLDSSSDDDRMPHALPIEDDDLNSGDMSGPPTTGAQYLRQVMAEAKQCPKVVVAKIDRSKFAGKQTFNVKDHHKLPETPDCFKPRPEWQKQQVKKFTKVRQRVDRTRRESPKSQCPSEPFPERQDELGWCRFCHGDRLAEDLVPRDVARDEGDDEGEVEASPGRGLTSWVDGERMDVQQTESPEATPQSTTNEPAPRPIAGYPPLTSLVLALDHPQLEELLRYHVQWFSRGAPMLVVGSWLYALVAALQVPLTPTMTSCLRELTRLCVHRRAGMKTSHEEELPHVNLFICIVAGFFHQKDLADHL